MGLLGATLPQQSEAEITPGAVLAGTPETVPLFKTKRYSEKLAKLTEGGYLIENVKIEEGSCVVIVANDDKGVLYGIFGFLKLLQTYSSLSKVDIISSPLVQWRMLNHWDNLDGSIERGYAGKSIWKWEDLPGAMDPRYKDYARADASIGINGVVLNNVNSDPEILDARYLAKVAALANVFRPYGIRVFLSANFGCPKVLGHLKTADPLDPSVIAWWKAKTDEIYKLIPDFGGLLVKANSEGQPGPEDYGRTFAQGANMMADALAPHKGVLIWRAFVYKTSMDKDRAKMAYDAFHSFDGKFRSNVLLQIKNGPLDFQPREPFSPLFGAMPHTTEMMELQITQEYLGHSNAFIYLAPLFKEILESDTYSNGKGSTVAKVIDGSLQGQSITGIAGVANIGDDSDWTGYIFGQANWYAFGRLAWNHELSAEKIAREWIKMTITHDTAAIQVILRMMMSSRETLVDYETPLGLNLLCNKGDHYEPRPEVREYFHKADTTGLGFDRTVTGSNMVGQYFPPVSEAFNDIHSCPEKYLTWFHHVPWNYKMTSGRTLWNELCYKYELGVENVIHMQQQWNSLRSAIEPELFANVQRLLIVQRNEAKKWRDVCLKYFEKYSRHSIL